MVAKNNGGEDVKGPQNNIINEMVNDLNIFTYEIAC